MKIKKQPAESRQKKEIKSETVFCDITTLVRTPCCKILKSISDGVFTLDADKRIISFNSAAEAITGFKAEDAVGQYCLRQGRRNLTPCNLAPSGMMRLSRARLVGSALSRRISSEEDAVPGTVSAIQTFEDILGFIPLTENDG